MRTKLILLLILFFSSSMSMASDPTSVVRETVDKVMDTLMNVEGSPDRKWRIIAKTISPTFDFKSLSQRTIDSEWREATSQDKKKLIDYFSQYLEDIYRTKMTGFVPSKIDYIGEQFRKDRAIVDSLVYSSGKKYLVSYRLKLKDGDWYIYDIFFDDNSIVDNWKEVFGAIIKSEGLDGLLNKMELKIIDSPKTNVQDFK